MYPVLCGLLQELMKKTAELEEKLSHFLDSYKEGLSLNCSLHGADPRHVLRGMRKVGQSRAFMAQVVYCQRPNRHHAHPLPWVPLPVKPAQAPAQLDRGLQWLHCNVGVRAAGNRTGAYQTCH